MSNVLLDTHIGIWAINGDERLPEEARKIILDEDNEIFYSLASVWEITIKNQSKPKEMNFSGKEFKAYCDKAGFIEIPIKNTHIFNLHKLDKKSGDPIHKDPFDRIMLSQAMIEDMLFLTSDSKLAQYDIENVVYV